MTPPPIVKCTTCHRHPRSMNGARSECSHVECPHRPVCWATHTPSADGRTPPRVSPDSEQEN